MLALPTLPLLLLLAGCTRAAYKLQERYSWNQLDFAFPNERLKEQAIASGDYIPQNGLPVGVEHFGNRLFVTVPRWRDGKYMPRFPVSQIFQFPQPNLGSTSRVWVTFVRLCDKSLCCYCSCLALVFAAN